jgi:hypothetical protein
MFLKIFIRTAVFLRIVLLQTAYIILAMYGLSINWKLIELFSSILMAVRRPLLLRKILLLILPKNILKWPLMTFSQSLNGQLLKA